MSTIKHQKEELAKKEELIAQLEEKVGRPCMSERPKALSDMHVAERSVAQCS